MCPCGAIRNLQPSTLSSREISEFTQPTEVSLNVAEETHYHVDAFQSTVCEFVLLLLLDNLCPLNFVSGTTHFSIQLNFHNIVFRIAKCKSKGFFPRS